MFCMSHTHRLLAAGSAACLLLSACGGGTPSTQANNAAPPSSTQATQDAHGHEHDDGHDHDGHDHGEGESHDHSDAQRLGTVTIGGVAIEVSQDGPVRPGEEAHFDLKVPTDSKFHSIRVWIGDAEGTGALKSKAEIHDGSAHVHAEAPDPMPALAALWIEVEVEGQPKASGSIAFK